MPALNDVKLSLKIVFSLVFAGVLSIILVGGASYYMGSKTNASLHELEIMHSLTSRRDQLRRFQAEIIGDLEFLANMRDVAPMFKVLTNAIEATEKQIGEGAIKRAYVDESPHPVGERQLLDFADDGSKYSAMHKRLHPTLRKYLNSRGYYDIFLINPESLTIFPLTHQATAIKQVLQPCQFICRPVLGRPKPWLGLLRYNYRWSGCKV